SARYYALLVGIPILVYVTRSLLRTLIGAHRLVWADLRASAPKPKLGATLRLLTLLVAFFVVAGLASVARAQSPRFGLVASLACAIAYGGIWFVVSLQLPHRGTHWKALIPGALVFGLGAEVVQLAAAYVLAPYAISKQGTYGALGTAAALLLGLFILSRLV